MIWDWDNNDGSLLIEPDIEVQLDGIRVTHVAKCETGTEGYLERFVTNDKGLVVDAKGILEKETLMGNVQVIKK